MILLMRNGVKYPPEKGFQDVMLGRMNCVPNLNSEIEKSEAIQDPLKDAMDASDFSCKYLVYMAFT